ncbi:MAG: hypothetical protein HKN29_16860 [Rhodothermales bacterium]|nr:hypothetical protein [Rhodothermales bacterium]
MGPLQNLIIIGSIWLVSIGLGTWMTFFRQPGELEQLRKTEQLARMQQSEIASLLSEENIIRGQAAEIQAQWDSRYKSIPKKLATHEVIGYLNGLTDQGFESFNLIYDEDRSGKDFNAHIFSVQGRATYRALYQFVWAIENYRSFYRIVNFELSHIDLPSMDKKTGRERVDVLVSFDFELQAYYGGSAGLSVEDTLPGRSKGVIPATNLPPVPASVLPARQPAKNPFYPIIMSEIPPNTYGLLDLDRASLISIVDGKAVFTSDSKAVNGDRVSELISVGVGDDVYLGRIIMVDPINNKVVARLNIGGIMDERIFELDAAPNFRQAIGPAQLAPSN